MRETGVVRFRFSGDPVIVDSYRGRARTELGQLKNRMQAFGTSSLSHSRTYPDGVAVTVASHYGQDTIQVDAPVRTPEQAKVVEEALPAINTLESFTHVSGSWPFVPYEDAISDLYAIAETAKNGTYSTDPAAKRYPLLQLKTLLGAKQWAAAWAFCNGYFARASNPCAYLKRGWETSEVGTDVLVIDPSKMAFPTGASSEEVEPPAPPPTETTTLWNFFTAKYPTHYKNVVYASGVPLADFSTSPVPAELAAHFADDITAAELVEVLAPFFGAVTNDERYFFPDSSSMVVVNHPSGALTFYTYDPGDITKESNSYVMFPNSGPFDHTGEYVTLKFTTVETFQQVREGTGIRWVRRMLQSFAEYVKVTYTRSLYGHSVIGTEVLALSPVTTRVARSYNAHAADNYVDNPHITLPQYYVTERDGLVLRAADHEFAFTGYAEDPGALLQDPGAHVHLAPVQFGVGRAPLGWVFNPATGKPKGTVYAMPNVVDTEFSAYGKAKHRNYVDGKYEIVSVEGTQQLNYQRRVTNTAVFDGNQGWGAVAPHTFQISQLVTVLDNIDIGGGFWSLSYEHRSDETVYRVGSAPRFFSAYWPRIAPAYFSYTFSAFKHFLYHPASGNALLADYLPGEEAVSSFERGELKYTRLNWLLDPTPENKQLFLDRFRIVYNDGIDETLLMNSFWGYGQTLVI